MFSFLGLRDRRTHLSLVRTPVSWRNTVRNTRLFLHEMKVHNAEPKKFSTRKKFSARNKRTWEMYRCAHNMVQIIIVVVPGVPDVCPRCYQQQLGQNPFLKERDPLLASVARRQVQKQGSGDVHVPMRCWIGQYLHGAVAIHHCYSS